MDKHLFTDEQRAEVKELVHEAISEWVKSYGLTIRNVAIGLAAVLAALAIIGKALLAILGFFGIGYLNK